MTDNLGTVRIDKWLWAVRICKTRAIATDLCKKQKVKINGQNVKPSREVKTGQIVIVKKDGIDWRYKVLQCIEKRVGPKIVLENREDLTSAEELHKLKVIKGAWVPRRKKGEGRPTKKDRRAIDRLNE